MQLGAATGVAAVLGGPAALARAAGETPSHLLRSSYVPLAGQQFGVAGKVVRLGVVDDLAGAADDADLRGHPEAFALTFHGPPAAFAPAVQTFTHPALGRFSLFVTPVGAVEGQLQRYEVVVDRSVGAPRRPPAPAPGLSPPPAHPGSEEAAAEARAELRQELTVEARRVARRIKRRRRVRRRKLKRRRAARNRSAMRKRAATGRYTAVRRGAATVIG